MSKFMHSLLIVGLMLFSGCSENDDPVEELAKLGILGTWEQTDITIDGITSLTPIFGVELEFVADDDPSDLSGVYRYVEDGRFYAGTFTLNLEDRSISFIGDNELERNFTIGNSGQSMILSYMEDGSLFETGWIKLD